MSHITRQQLNQYDVNKLVKKSQQSEANKNSFVFGVLAAIQLYPSERSKERSANYKRGLLLHCNALEGGMGAEIVLYLIQGQINSYQNLSPHSSDLSSAPVYLCSTIG
jgi:hypothetical protein